MKKTSMFERYKWREYRGSEHAWLPVQDLGMQRSLCGYLARNARLTQPAGRRCVICACIMDKDFATAPRYRAGDSVARLQDMRRVGDHVRRAVQGLKLSTLDASVCEEALAKLRAVEADLTKLYRLERAGTAGTPDDELLADADTCDDSASEGRGER